MLLLKRMIPVIILGIMLIVSVPSVVAEEMEDIELPEEEIESQDLNFQEPMEPQEPEITEEYEQDFIRGTVVQVEEIDTQELKDFVDKEQKAKIKITSGELEGETHEIVNTQTGHPLHDIELHEQQDIILLAEYNNGELVQLNIHDIVRDKYLYYLLAGFAVLLLIVGGLKGLKTLLTLIFTGFMVIQVLIPLLLEGYNPIWLTVLITSFVSIVTLTIIGGLEKKTLAAVIGTIGGVSVAGFLALIVGEAVSLTGVSSEEAQMLYFAESGEIDLQGLLFAGIIIGALGAVMDIGMSIASACYEMVELNPKVKSRDLFKAGLNVGRDIMGTMSNTLILAYIGSAMPLLLLFYMYEMPYEQVINMDMMATEVVRAVTGSIGLLVSIPITALVAGVLFPKIETKNRSKKLKETLKETSRKR